MKDEITSKSAFGSSAFFDKLAEFGIVIAFIFLCICLSFANENFMTWGNWVNVLRQTSINGILAIGMTYVILTKGIDSSHSTEH